MVTTLAVLVSLGLLMVTMSVLLPVGRAADLRAGSVTGADAAALAGAEQIRDDFVASLVAGPRRRSAVLAVLTCGLGSASAQDFAARNATRMLSYCYLPGPDEVRVQVQGTPTTDDGRRARSSAVAALGVRFATCSWHDDPPPSPTSTTTPPSPPPTPSPPPPPPPDTRTELRCDGLTLRFFEHGVTKRLRLLTPAGVVRDALRPRLVE